MRLHLPLEIPCSRRAPEQWDQVRGRRSARWKSPADGAVLGLLLVWVALFASAAGPVWAKSTPPPKTIEQWESRVRRAEDRYGEKWGVAVADLQSDQIVYRYQPERQLIPASNRKLIVLGMALHFLGPDYIYRTNFGLGRPHEGEKAHYHGDLIVRASGDPSIGFPNRDGTQENPLDLFGGWARKLGETGIAFVHGDLVIDATAFGADQNCFPAVWESYHRKHAYAPAPSALAACQNLLRITVKPAKSQGGAGRLSIFPSSKGLEIDNKTRSYWEGAKGVSADFSEGREDLVVTGRVRIKARPEVVVTPIPRPIDYLGTLLLRALEEQGIELTGGLRIETVHAPGGPSLEIAQLLETRRSPTLDLMLINMMRRSNNFQAEQIWRSAAARVTGSGGLAEARRVEQSWYRRIGHPWIEPGYDGSGLSRRNRVSANELMLVAKYLYYSTYRDFVLQTMPVSGRRGTLRKRSFFKAGRRVSAKTGTLSGASALTGYIHDRQGHPRYVFSVIGNAKRDTHGRMSIRVNHLMKILIRRMDAGMGPFGGGDGARSSAKGTSGDGGRARMKRAKPGIKRKL